MNAIKVRTLLSRFSLLLSAVLPVAYNKIDWLFYTMSIAILLGMAISFALAVKIIRQDKNSLLDILDNPEINIYDVAISLVGCIVNYAMGYAPVAFFWCGVLIYSLIRVIQTYIIEHHRLGTRYLHHKNRHWRTTFHAKDKDIILENAYICP